MLLICLCVLTFAFTHKAQANSFGLRVSPVSLLIGAADVSLDIALGSFVLSPEILFWSYDFGSTESEIQAYGASLSYHFSGALVDSWYLGVSGKKIAVTVEDTDEIGELDTTYVGGRAGYIWVWNTFYMNLGATFGSLADSDVIITNRNTSISRTESLPSFALGLGVEFKLGFSF